MNVSPSVVRRRSLSILVILLASVLIQLVFLSVLPDPWRRNQNDDYFLFYEPVAQNILAGKGIVGPRGNVATSYPPGYPVILSVIFYLSDVTGMTKPALIKTVNVLSTSASSLFVFLIAELMFGTRIGLISSVLWMTYPFNLWLIKQPNSEVPFIFLLYFGIWMFTLAILRRYFALIPLVGVLLALAALVRPISLFFGLHLAVVLLFCRGMHKIQRMFRAMLLLGGFLLTVAPWEIHVLSSTGQLIPLSTNGPRSIVDGLTFALRPGKDGDQVAVPQDVRMLMERIEEHGATLGTMRGILQFVGRETASNPAAVVKLGALKIVRSWYGTNAKWEENRTLAIQMLYLVMILGGIALGIRMYRDRRFWVIFLVSVIVYFWGMTVVALSILRYMVPAMGLGIILAAITIDRMITHRGVYAS